MQRKCGRCSTVKNLIYFPKNINKYKGYGHTCKECSKVIISDYHKTEIGVLTVLYSGQKRSSKYRKMDMPNYTKKEFIEWAYKNNFKTLFDAWKESNYTKDLKPSPDRINDYKPYSFDNLRLVTWKENRDKYSIDKIKGINNKQNKPVYQYNKDGKFLRSFYSISEAARASGADVKNIIFCCNKVPKYNTARGFVWRRYLQHEINRLEAEEAFREAR